MLPGTGGTLRHARIVGKSKAIEMMAVGALYSFEDAKAVGLVNEVLPRETFWDDVMKYAKQFVPPGKASKAVGHIKRAVCSNDTTECAAIHEVFGPRARHVPVSSIKSMLGHTMGAASALEAIACALTVHNNMIPPTINYETPDPECDIDCVPNKAHRQTVNVALNNSYAFGGNNASLVLRKFL